MVSLKQQTRDINMQRVKETYEDMEYPLFSTGTTEKRQKINLKRYEIFTEIVRDKEFESILFFPVCSGIKS